MHRWLILAIALWGILLFGTDPYGYDLAIYQYNADLTLSGQPAFGRPLVESMNTIRLPSDPIYLDYTGAQHLLYVGLQAFNGWQLYALALFASTVVLLWRKSKAAALMLAFSPAFLIIFAVGAWTDKLIFLLIPLIALALHDRPVWLATFVGLICGFNGLLLFFAPIVLIKAYRDKQLFPAVGAMGAGFALSMFPFFPDSLSGWSYRAARMNADTPFWWSFWRIFSADIYTPMLDKMVAFGVAGLGVLAYLQKRVNFETALLLAVSCVALTGVYNSDTRVLPVLLLIMAFSRASRVQWLVFALLTCLYPVINPISNASITAGQVAVFWTPVLFAIGVYARNRMTRKRLVFTRSPAHVHA